MPPATRPTRQRLLTNENDENANSTRMTRAKAAALDVDVMAPPTKQPLQAKKAAVNANPAQRKRAALGDVSNVGKADAAEAKKPLATKTGLVSKAAQPTGVQKNTSHTRTASTRSALGVKKADKADKTRAGSGSNTIAASHKRKATLTSSTAVTSKQDGLAEGEPARKKTMLEEDKKTKTVKRVEVKEDAKENVQHHVEADQVEDLSDDVAPKPVIYVCPPGVKDLDLEDLDDPTMAAEYAREIFDYLRELEIKSMPIADYMTHQDDLEWKTRGILVDWLIEVHTRFHLLPETLFLAVNIIDRFLSQKVVNLDRLQLVGITAMFIASKYEEVLSPHVTNFKHVADDGFTEAEILSAERFILQTLDYDLSYPNPMNFLRRISKADNYDVPSRTIGKYLVEIALLDHRFMDVPSSKMAAAAMYLSRLILDRGEWDDTIAFYAGYTEIEIDSTVQLMVDYLVRPVIHEAFYKKYASKKFMKASLLTRQWAKKNADHFDIEEPGLSLDELYA